MGVVTSRGLLRRSPFQGIPLALPGPQTGRRGRQSWRGHRSWIPESPTPSRLQDPARGCKCAPSRKRFRTALSSTTLERRVRRQAVDDIPVGSRPRMNGTRQNEKRQRPELNNESQVDGGSEAGGVHRRATGADAAWPAHPGPDDRPRPPAAAGFPAWSHTGGPRKEGGSLADL